MTELLLALIIFSLLGILVYTSYEHAKERRRLTNAYIARTPEQFRDLELTEKVKPIDPTPKPPDLIPEHDLEDKEFAQYIQNQVS